MTVGVTVILYYNFDDDDCTLIAYVEIEVLR